MIDQRVSHHREEIPSMTQGIRERASEKAQRLGSYL
jgi:hypothetical protein